MTLTDGRDQEVTKRVAYQLLCTQRHHFMNCRIVLTFFPQEELKKIQMAFPVFDTGEAGHMHAPVDYKQLKELVESVRSYGVSANFTVSSREIRQYGHDPVKLANDSKGYTP